MNAFNLVTVAAELLINVLSVCIWQIKY